MGGRLVMDNAKVMAKLKRHVAEKQRALDIQVAKDCTPYVPYREGTLSRSVARSQPGSGKVIWDEPYARRMYYGVNYRFSKPQATHHWFEKAKGVHKKDWIRMMNHD